MSLISAHCTGVRQAAFVALSATFVTYPALTNGSSRAVVIGWASAVISIAVLRAPTSNKPRVVPTQLGYAQLS